MICYVCQENYPNSQIGYQDYGIEPHYPPINGWCHNRFILIVCVHCLGFRCRGQSMIEFWREYKPHYHFLESLHYAIAGAEADPKFRALMEIGSEVRTERYTKGQGVYYYWDPSDFRRRNG